MVVVTLIVLGLAFGSFINALVWRTHQLEVLHTKKARKTYSIATGRSMCSVCRHRLATKDLIPVLSWFVLKGKCRYCKAPIVDTPIPEVLTPTLFVLSYVFWPFDWGIEGKLLLSIWLVALVCFVALVIYDLRWKLLPNKIVFPLIALGVVWVALRIATGGGIDAMLSGLWGVTVGGGIFWALFQVSDGKWIGGGDVKLGWALGLLVGGPAMSLLMIFLASLLGTAVSLPLITIKKANAKTHIPFGPFLITAAFVVQLFGVGIIGWYKRKIGLH